MVVDLISVHSRMAKKQKIKIISQSAYSPSNRGRGFTLIELMVVMSIILIMSALILASYRSGQSRYSLNLAAQQLVSDLRQAQNMAISGKNLAVTYKGYGVYFQTGGSSYILFGDVNGNRTYETPSSDILLETTPLPQGIKIASIVQGSSSYSSAEVDFEPPAPKTYIKGKSAEQNFNALVVNLSTADGLLTKSVLVSPLGLIRGD